MNLSEIAVLRTKLRELNIEYSALVRRKAGRRYVRENGAAGGGTAGTDGVDRRGAAQGLRMSYRRLQLVWCVVIGGLGD